MIALKALYLCVVVAWSPPETQAHPELRESVEMIHCGRSGSEEVCRRQGEKAAARLVARWRQWGHETEIGDIDVECDQVFVRVAAT